jgi:hypothetical protein
MVHYQSFFAIAAGLTLTAEDKTDIVAFMKLLR